MSHSRVYKKRESVFCKNTWTYSEIGACLTLFLYPRMIDVLKSATEKPVYKLLWESTLYVYIVRSSELFVRLSELNPKTFSNVLPFNALCPFQTNRELWRTKPENTSRPRNIFSYSGIPTLNELQRWTHWKFLGFAKIFHRVSIVKYFQMKTTSAGGKKLNERDWMGNNKTFYGRST